ncbi:hypothetical protein Mapa_003847 [Marchantia paleacea]|nr:hypothetical protein Mapa_003847 [Marchantia paleacea]
MVDAALVLAFATSVIVYLWIYRWRQRNQLGPKTWPYFGNLLELRANAARFHDWTYDYMSKSPTATIDVYFRHHRGIMVGRPDIVEHILKTRFNNYIKGPILAERLGDLLGNGIFNADGDVWKQHRKLASFEFSSMKLREVSTEAYREHALRLLTFLDTVADSHKQVDIQDLFLRMTMDSICKVGFGVDQRNLNLDLPEIKFAKAFDALSEWSTARNFDTTWKLKRRFNIGREKLFRALLPDVDSFTYSVIQDRREEITRLESMNQTLDKHDLLSRFMSGKDQNGEPLSDKVLRDAILNFVIAGRDTSAVTLAWFTYMLSCNPEVAEKCYQELNEVFGEREEDDVGRGPCRFSNFANSLTYDTLGKLHYLQAALSETLRLYPPVARDGKYAVDDDVLPDGTVVKSGDSVVYVPYAMGRLELLWGPDASQFRPERWLKDNIYQHESPYKFSAFQAGQRICLGKDTAYLQMKMTAALLLRFFRIQVVPKQDVTYVVSLVMSIRNGLQVTVHRR